MFVDIAMQILPLLALMATAQLAAVSRGPAVVPERSVEQIVRSSAAPRISIAVDSALPYLGRVAGDAMNGRARYEQFLFAETSAGRLKRVVVVHFEHAVEGSDLRFRYPRLEMVKLGEHEYLHQSFPAKGVIFTKPSAAALLRERGLQSGDDWILSRWVRATDEELRSEIIIFYMEPAPPLPASPEELGLEGKRRDLWKPFDEHLTDVGRPLFRIVSEE
jgi:hypothetical protein